MIPTVFLWYDKLMNLCPSSGLSVFQFQPLITDYLETRMEAHTRYWLPMDIS